MSCEKEGWGAEEDELCGSSKVRRRSNALEHLSEREESRGGGVGEGVLAGGGGVYPGGVEGGGEEVDVGLLVGGDLGEAVVDPVGETGGLKVRFVVRVETTFVEGRFEVLGRWAQGQQTKGRGEAVLRSTSSVSASEGE